MEENPDMKKTLTGIIIGTLVLGGVVFIGYNISKKKGLQLSLPSGGGYTGETQSPVGENPPTAPVRFTVADDVNWLTYSGKYYSFSFPQGLVLQKFVDPVDSVGIAWGNLDPKTNLLADVQSISEKSPQYVGNTEEFVKNWWKFYPGLKGVLSVNKFSNTNGLTGYKAIYINQSGQTPNVDVFFQIPGNQVVHLANGILDPEIFNRVVDSVKYLGISTPPTTAPTEAPAE